MDKIHKLIRFTNNILDYERPDGLATNQKIMKLPQGINYGFEEWNKSTFYLKNKIAYIPQLAKKKWH